MPPDWAQLLGHYVTPPADEQRHWDLIMAIEFFEKEDRSVPVTAETLLQELEQIEAIELMLSKQAEGRKTAVTLAYCWGLLNELANLSASVVRTGNRFEGQQIFEASKLRPPAGESVKSRDHPDV